MTEASDLPLAIAPAALFGLLLWLRLRFPNVSGRTEIAVLAATTVLFFLTCHLFLTRSEAPRVITTNPPGPVN